CSVQNQAQRDDLGSPRSSLSRLGPAPASIAGGPIVHTLAASPRLVSRAGGYPWRCRPHHLPVVLSAWMVPAGSTAVTPPHPSGATVTGRSGTVVWATASELVSVSAAAIAIVRIFIGTSSFMRRTNDGLARWSQMAPPPQAPSRPRPRCHFSTLLVSGRDAACNAASQSRDLCCDYAQNDGPRISSATLRVAQHQGNAVRRIPQPSQ